MVDSERDFELGNLKFKLLKLDAFKQFHVVRRIAPILSEMLPAMKSKPKPAESLSEDDKLKQMADFVGPIMNGLSKLSDQDADFVLINLLSAVEMQQAPGNWARVAQNGMIMIQTFDLPVLLQLAGRAFMYNLSGFFAVAQKSS